MKAARATVLLLMLGAGLAAAGQDLTVRITIHASQPTVARIEGHFLRAQGVPNLSFQHSYAGVPDLDARISDLKLADANKQPVEYKGLQPGEYLAESNVTWFIYAVDLKPTNNPLAAAHVSWLGTDGGMLALDDLLPQPTDTHVRVTFQLPIGWRSISNEDHPAEDVLDVHNAQRAVVFVGKGWRVSAVYGTRLKLVLAGDPGVSDTTISTETGALYKAYSAMFGSAPGGPAEQIVVAKFPASVPSGRWEAETRGSTVTIMTSGGLSPADSEQRLHQQLRHELFHLWIPNGVNLTGNYDWFYEGFATYEEQKLGVEMNQIRFEDFLATLGRAYDIDGLTSPRRSLIDASRDRWAGSSSQVYARGMLVAFLIDIALLDASKGKSTAESLLRQIFEEHRPPATASDGNDAIIAAMRVHPELAPIVDDYISGSKPVDPTLLFQKAGIQVTIKDQLTQLTVADKLSGRQKALLDKLGYNSWRKLAPK